MRCVVFVAIIALCAGTKSSFMLEEFNLFDKFSGSHSSDKASLPKQIAAGIDLSNSPKTLTPLVIVPSLIGSQLQAQLEHKTTSHVYCKKDSKWFELFLPADVEMVPPLYNCWAENIGLTFDNATGLYSSLPGVSVRVPYWGQLEGVEYLDAANKTPVWSVVIDTLTKLGYEPGVNLLGAPYDWRVGPTQVVADQYGPLKALIEDAYTRNNNTAVALTSLSLGGLYTAVFLNSYVEQSWKDQYIDSFTSLSGAFGGSMAAIYELLCLNPANTYGINSVVLRDLVRSWGSTSWLLPVEAGFNDTVVVSTPERNYTAANMTQLFIDAQVEEVVEIVRSCEPFFAPGPVGVPVNVVYGTNVSTLATLSFASMTNFTQPNGETDLEGDGTLTVAGLIGLPQQWIEQQSQPVKFFGVPNMQHADAITNEVAIAVLLQSLGFSSL